MRWEVGWPQSWCTRRQTQATQMRRVGNAGACAVTMADIQAYGRSTIEFWGEFADALERA